MNKKYLTSVRAIITKKNRILLAQRGKGGSHPGKWEFPGGKTEGKMPIGAVRREVREETGLKLIKPRFIKEKKDGKFFVKYYKGGASGKIKIQRSELSKAKWFTRSQAKRLKLVPHTRTMLKRR